MKREQEQAVYTIQGMTFIVTPVYHPQEGGKKMSDILLKWMCEDAQENAEKA